MDFNVMCIDRYPMTKAERVASAQEKRRAAVTETKEFTPYEYPEEGSSSRCPIKLRKICCCLPKIVLFGLGGTLVAPISELVKSVFIRPCNTLTLLCKDGCSLKNCCRSLATVVLTPVDLGIGLIWGATTGGIRACMDAFDCGERGKSYFNDVEAFSFVSLIQDKWILEIRRSQEEL
ncbi:hypothetical protein [Kistimonas asteriae]|uniref:hypothetical protein n=1 Tax=Kistimonas asteriae TaxID=517724 RepID=UPI001BABA80A|nr:hypothetical protein [Kistimonas asteriae]